MGSFHSELEKIIKSYAVDVDYDTPSNILRDYIIRCLDAYYKCKKHSS